MPRSIPLILALALALTASATAGARGVHPQDGPHADVRLWIDETSVEFRISMNLVFLDEILPDNREDDASVHAVELPGIREGLVDYFREAEMVTVDGTLVDPVALECETLETDITLLPLFPKSGLRGLSKLMIVLEYPVEAPPQTVRLVWPVFPIDILTSTDEITAPLDIAAELNANGRMDIIYFTTREPEYIWHAPAEGDAELFLPVPAATTVPMLTVPALSAALGAVLAVALLAGVWTTGGRRGLLVLAPALLIAALFLRHVAPVTMPDPFAEGDALPSESDARAIFTPLHANIYQAFDYTDESMVYDALARSVDGPFLDTLYNEIYRSLIMYEEGGAVSRVASVTPLETTVGDIGRREPDGQATFSVVHRWQVEGVVYHWGHSHRRVNEYLAEYGVVATDAGWRISGSAILEQFRVESEPLPPAKGLEL